MDPLHETTETWSLELQSDRIPTHVASAPHLLQASPSRTTALEGERHSQTVYATF
jgi:hypothetical protein